MHGTTPLPLTIVGGYLGTGKTTLINHVLRDPQGERITVLVNDFGDIAIDDRLIKGSRGDVLTLANGCVCCSIGGDLMYALMDVLAQPRGPMYQGPDRLLIEASGVAEPQRIADIARAEPDLCLDAIVCTADATSVMELTDDPLVGTTVHNQLASADVIVLNKCDLSTSDRQARVHAWLQTCFDRTPIVTARHGNVPSSVLTGAGLAKGGAVGERPHRTPQFSEVDHETLCARWHHASTTRMNRETLDHALTSLPDEVLRLKGLVRAAHTNETLIVNVVGKRIDVTGRAMCEDDPQGVVLTAILRGDGRSEEVLREVMDGLFGYTN